MIKQVEKLKKRSIVLVLFDVLVYLMVGLALVLVHDGFQGVTLYEIAAILWLLFPLLLARGIFRIYNQVWRYATSEEYLTYVLADLSGRLLYILALRPLLPNPFWLTYWQALSLAAVNCLASLSARFLYQNLYRRGKIRENADAAEGSAKVKVAIIGAGSAGFYLARELQFNERSRYKPCLFIDNDPQKAGSIVSGLKVYSEADAFRVFAEQNIRDVILAISSSAAEKKQYLFDFYAGRGMRVMIYDLPFVEDKRSGEALGRYAAKDGKPVLRRFRLEDLLFRSPVQVDNGAAGGFYGGKTVLITGGGGSIGSEITRQLASYGPKKIIILDCYENNAYDIQQELKIAYGAALDVAVEISSVREARRMDEIMEQYRPDVVVHAAAHKHVPLMEHNSAEAIKNNVFGTLNVVDAAERWGAEKFILISTDKAVNPTNVMGASKQVCEMIVQSRKNRAAGDEGVHTQFMAVRFGNVLGSNGSVIPLFQRQIAAGGPVTITDKRIIRYFMTIPEAAQLVLEAGAMAKNGELYVLDMGKPVQILKLAEDMIRLSGFEPYRDIDIQEIGLREGEKLYEELLVRGEELDKTDNEMIFVERDKGPSWAEMEEKLDVLRAALEDGRTETIKAALREVVPTYQPLDAPAREPAPVH